MLRMPHCLDSRLTDGGKVVSLCLGIMGGLPALKADNFTAICEPTV
jgi:hypothetical protein